MRENLIVGILRETKSQEHRAPLVPSDVLWLTKRGIAVEVERSPQRVFSDQEYRKSGARIIDRVLKATLLLGVKEPRVADLNRSAVYMVFSHTIKGQFKNMPLLRSCLKKKITLIDYEKIIDTYGRRLAYFGRFAGICGIIDSLHYLGKKLQGKGIKNPFSSLRPSHAYASLKAAESALVRVYRRIKLRGFSEELTPFVIGITGHGNVSRGVQEMLRLLNPIEIHPQNMLEFVRHQKKKRHRIYKIVFLREEKFRAKDGKRFYFEEYLSNPEKFESNIGTYLPFLNILIHTSYWDKRFPRLVTKKMVRKLAREKPFRLEFIGDLSCDVNGSIELTHKTTTSNKPVFTYNPKRQIFVDGYKTKGITVLAVDNLPAQMPRDASVEFSALIRDHAYQIAVHGVTDVANHAVISGEIRRAVIVQSGRLRKNYYYLRKHLKTLVLKKGKP